MIYFNFFIINLICFGIILFSFDNWSQLLEVALPCLLQPLKCVVEFFAGGMEARSQDQLLPLFFFQTKKDLVQGGPLAIFVIPIFPKFISLTIIAMLK